MLPHYAFFSNNNTTCLQLRLPIGYEWGYTAPDLNLSQSDVLYIQEY